MTMPWSARCDGSDPAVTTRPLPGEADTAPPLVLRHPADGAARGIVVTLSTMMRLGCRMPLVSVGSTGMRSSGASRSLVVSGQTVTEAVASNRSSCTITTGRGLPV